MACTFTATPATFYRLLLRSAYTPSPNTYFSPNLSNTGGPRIYKLSIADYVLNHMNMHIRDYPTKSLNYKI